MHMAVTSSFSAKMLFYTIQKPRHSSKNNRPMRGNAMGWYYHHKWDGNGMGWDGSRNFVPITSYHPITITVICTTYQLPVGGMSALYQPINCQLVVCLSALYHPIDFPIPPPGAASHPIHNPPLEISTIPPHTHIQPPRYHRTAIIFLDISGKAGPLPPIAFALSAYYSYILVMMIGRNSSALGDGFFS